jgi:hypothetical protein
MAEASIDCAAVLVAQVADLHKGIDEKPQAAFGRQPAGRCMGRVDEAELLKILHDVAHRRGRQRHRDDAREIARADRLSRRQIALDDLAKDFARAFVDLREARVVRTDGDVLRHLTHRQPEGLRQLSVHPALRFKNYDGRVPAALVLPRPRT